MMSDVDPRYGDFQYQPPPRTVLRGSSGNLNPRQPLDPAFRNPEAWEEGDKGPTQTDVKQWTAMSRVRTMAIISLIFGLFAFLMIIAFAVWYWVAEDDITAKEIKKALGESTDATARFKNLDVDEDTTLGTNSQDDLTVNASVSSDLTPDTHKARNLGSDTRKWDNLYVDQVVFDGGVSIISETDYIVVDGQMGYKKRVKTLTASGLSHSGTPNVGVYNPPPDESGYTYILEEDPNDTYSFGITLPSATGSGNYYDFVVGTSMTTSLSDLVVINTASGEKFYGSTYVTSGPGERDSTGVSNQVAMFRAPKDENINSIQLSYLIVSDVPGIYEGTKISVTDVASGEWIVEGNVIVNNGLSTGAMSTPFS